MLKRRTIIFLLLLCFLLPTGLSIVAYFSTNFSEGEQVISILSSNTEEESNEQEKPEKEKEKQLPSFEFIPSVLYPGKFYYFNSFHQLNLLQGIIDLSTPPPKVS